MDSAKYREEFWRDVKESFVIDNVNMGPKRKIFLANMIKKSGVSSVLELGCCSGGNLKKIREQCPDLKIVGYDINERALKYAKEVEKIDTEFELGSLYDLSRFKDKSFDLVFTCAVLVHIPSEKVPYILENMTRIAKKFVFNIESQDKNSVMTTTNDVPYAWFTDYAGIYRSLGFDPHAKKMEKIVGKEKIGVARDLIWCNITNEELIK